MTEPSQDHPEPDKVPVEETGCCVVGGGPAGVVLSLLLARKGVKVHLLESHPDFDRDFRGDTVHPSVMDVMAEIGLADDILKLPHDRMQRLRLVTPQGEFQLADFRRLKIRFPFVTMLPQARFLDFLAGEAKKYPSFQLRMLANVQRLVEENGVVKGVRYRDHDNQWHELRAPLTVAADGRFSRLRKLAGFEPIKTSAPMDVLWFRLPRKSGDMDLSTGGFFITTGHLIVVINRGEEWQLGYIITKGTYKEQHERGLEEIRKHIGLLVPFLADRVQELKSWEQIAVLAVESNRLERWYKPGLLLIGDAAHTMSPVGGVGINYAVMDAVAAANLLTAPLLAGQVTPAHLAAVQDRREKPVRIIQKFQARMQNSLVVSAVGASGKPFRMPLWMRVMLKIPWLRDMPARMIAHGYHPEHVQ